MKVWACNSPALLKPASSAIFRASAIPVKRLLLKPASSYSKSSQPSRHSRVAEWTNENLIDECWDNI